MPTTYGNDIVYCLKSHCGVRGYCRQKWVLQVQIICKFSNERTCKRNKNLQGLSCGFEVKEEYCRPELSVIPVLAEPIMGTNSPFESDHKKADDDDTNRFDVEPD